MTSRIASLVAILAAAALGLSACSGGSYSAPAASPGGMEPSAAPTAADAAPGASGDGAVAGSALIGMVGTADDPNAYEIRLTDESGSPIESLPAGDYTLTFADRSDVHNFRLTGPGGVDVSTDVEGTDETTVEITLVAGTYTIVCDPHPSTMSGEIEVTG